ncbi:hypothetical protein BCR33DRAFT_193505 [Rhizoclosmatium globosum]|uniref:Uncharacterized protein n=1 Tax=Rhizoclosmatium globosum TaxID=329046 RepID=A0A1Y2CFN2_9FUNG|nr:hypothetical protein BCR33DRAFT_193505 [Rhizoclosmatium globosum]|eukprot:ORY45105.1 hypothetical protein BCR33DRAFT_193505 [Rhizoclosmatium globosum]
MRTQKTAFRVWFRRARARALEREREREWRQEKAVWFYRNVLVGSGNTTGSSVWKPDVSRVFTGGLDHLRENHVAANRFNPDHIFWKLIVSTPSYIATPETEYTDRITSLWMCSKFGAGGDGSGQQNRLREDAEGYRVDELLRVSLLDLQDPDTKRSGRRKSKNSVSLSVNVSHVQVRKEAEYPLKPNAEAVCSGTQAVLFLFSGAKVGGRGRKGRDGGRARGRGCIRC